MPTVTKSEVSWVAVDYQWLKPSFLPSLSQCLWPQEVTYEARMRCVPGVLCAYRSDFRGRAGAREWLQGPSQTTAIIPNTKVTQVLTAQTLGTVGAAHSTIVDHNCEHRTAR